MDKKEKVDQTNCLHDGYEPDPSSGATRPATVVSTSFAYSTAEDISSVFAGEKLGFTYSRINNPTVARLEQKMAALEGGIGAIACSSGMAAITCALLAFANSGDRILSSSKIFGGTYSLLQNTFRRLGIQVDFFDPTQPQELVKLVGEKTRVIFTETIGNPILDVAHINELVQIAHRNRLPLIVDNTLTTPCLFRGADFNVDLIIHSTTKYIDGQGRAVGGCIVDNGLFNWDIENYDHLVEYNKRFRSLALLAYIRTELLRNLGCCMSPMTASIHDSGLETLSLRIERHCDNAMKLSQFFSDHPLIKKVHYPGLKDDPGQKPAKKLFNGFFGGLVTIEVESKKQAFSLINNLKYAQNLANIGDAKTLIIHPASTIYHSFTEKERTLMGVNDNLVRISVGLENVTNIIDDFVQALDKCKKEV